MIAFFVRHRTAANLLMLAVLVLGSLGYSRLRRQLFPDFNPVFITVTVPYPGATPAQVEESIARPVTKAVNGIGGIHESIATSRDGLFELRLQLAYGEDQQEVLDDVQSAIDNQVELPDDAEEPIVVLITPDEEVVDISVVGALENGQLHRLATDIRDEVLDLPGVQDAKLREPPTPTIKVTLDRVKLIALSLTVEEVARQINSHSLDLPAGRIEADERSIQLRLVDQRRTVSDFKELPILTNQRGLEVPLKSVAEIREVFTTEDSSSRFNGKPAISMTVTKIENGDLIDTAETIREYVRTRQGELPSGIELYVWNDRSTMVRQRLAMVSRNLLQGVVLVFVTLWVFLQLRLAFWISIGVIVSFAGGFYVMYLFGMSLDMFSLFSLILALGLIVDDAIVIGENIYAHCRDGSHPKQAAVSATKEVAVGVVSSMLTTSAILLPLMMLRGELGQIIRVIPVVVLAALGVSLIEAFFILPHHLAHAAKPAGEKGNPVRQKIDEAIDALIEKVYRPALRFSVDHLGIVFSLAVAGLLLTTGLLASGRVESIMMEPFDTEVVVAHVLLPDGTDTERTRDVVRRLEEAISPTEGREDETRVTNVGHRPSGKALEDGVIVAIASDVGVNVAAAETGGHVATVMVQLVPSDARNITSDDVAREWRDRFGAEPDIVQLTFQSSFKQIGGKPIEFRLQGEDYESLKKASLMLQDKLLEYPGISNVTDDLRPGKQEVLIRLKPAARALGITTRDLGIQLRDAFWGSEVQRFQRGKDSFIVEVVLDENSRGSLADLDDFYLMTHDGRDIPFNTVATAELAQGYSRLTQLNGRPTVTVGADLDFSEGNPILIASDLDRRFWPALREEHPGIVPLLSGQIKEGRENQREMYLGFAAGMAVMYVLLSYVFGSFLEPIIVMLSIPFGLIGAIFGHFVFGIPWQDTSLFGFMILSGIVVNDSIVLVAFIKERTANGMPLKEAIMQAGCRRFRAVTLTSLTTAMGLLPILLEPSFQARLIVPVAVSIAFGILFATTLILLLIPALFGWFARFSTPAS